MFLGHYGLALAAKRAVPRASLGTLTFAAQFLDELWPVFLLRGIERVRIVPGLMAASPLDFIYYPFSHSLLMALVWGVLIGGFYFALRRYAGGAWVLGLLVVSHWFLDLPMHRADLPLMPGSNEKVGFGLWNSVSGTLILEFGIFAIGLGIYLKSTRARGRIGSWAVWIYAFTLAALFLASNGAPPPNPHVLALTALGIWLFVALAWWVDRHRDPRDTAFLAWEDAR